MARYGHLVGGALTFAGIDQGIDFTGAGPVYALGNGVVTRLVPRGSGWPGEGALLVYKLDQPIDGYGYIYIAEDFRIAPGLHVGSRVRTGQLLGYATGSGKAPGIEVGWADAAGHAIAHAPSSGPTPAGQVFNRFAAGGTASAGASAAGAAAGSANSYLEGLWINAGGSRGLAPTMAAISLAENRSSNPRAKHVNKDGSVDRGLWQINSRNYDSDSLYDPLTNARWAVRIQGSQGLGAWTTYRTGAYKAFLPSTSAGAAAAGASAGAMRTRPGDNSGDGGGGSGLLDAFSGAAGWAGSEFEGVASKAWRDFVGVVEGPLAIVKAALWLFSKRNWLRMVEFVTGLGLLFMSAVGLALLLAARSEGAQAAADVASALPGPAGAAGRAVKIAGSREGRRRAAKRAIPRRARERAAEQEGTRQTKRRDESKRMAKARERGRNRSSLRKREKQLRREIPDYDVIPF